MKYNNILITGGAGFIGSNIAVSLKKDFPNVIVTVLDNLKRTGSHLNLKRLKENKVLFIHGDIRLNEDFNTSSFDLMIECSAETSVSSGYNGNLSYLFNTNLNGTINCLENVRKNKADIIFLSTSRVYPIANIRNLTYKETKTRFEIEKSSKIIGISKKGISENFTLNGARSLYGASKLSSELIIQEYIDIFGIKAVINRLSCVSGKWQMGTKDQGILAFWILSHIFNNPLTYTGYNGKQVRDILHVEDLYRLIKIQILNMSKCSGQIFNIGGGYKNSFSLIELTKICREITGNKINIKNERAISKYDIPYFITDYTKANTLLNWQSEKTLINIVSDVYEWIINNKSLLIF